MLNAQDKVDFSKFGIKFQENLVKLIVLDRMFADQIGEVLDMSFFESKSLQVLSNVVYSHKEEYKIHPSLQTLAMIVKSGIEGENEIVQKQVRDLLVRIYANQDVDGREYIKDTALDFCKKQKLKEAIIKSVELLNKSSFDEISGLINKALTLGQENNFGHDYIKDFEMRYTLKTRNAVTTGWDEIDAITRGGLGKGELGVVIAATGGGKSHVLVHLGAAAIQRGLNVVHYSMELSAEDVALRYDSLNTKTKFDDLREFKDLVKENIQDIKGTLTVKKYPPRKATVNTIRNHLEKLRNRGQEIDLILVDYADLIRPMKYGAEKRHDLEIIYEELVAIGEENGCPLYTASQGNRGSLNAELITMESIAEAYSKCWPAHLIFTLSRTIEDKKNKTGRLFIAKNRSGIDGSVFSIYMDTAKSEIRITADATDEVLNKDPAKSQLDNLKQKYKELKAEQKVEIKED
tara:strand:+ start:3597 stop:4982 length:1386 start_codon:yes stop_codon:yes gene_type:complete